MAHIPGGSRENFNHHRGARGIQKRSGGGKYGGELSHIANDLLSQGAALATDHPTQLAAGYAPRLQKGRY